MSSQHQPQDEAEEIQGKFVASMYRGLLLTQGGRLIVTNQATRPTARVRSRTTKLSNAHHVVARIPFSAATCAGAVRATGCRWIKRPVTVSAGGERYGGDGSAAAS